MTDLFKALAKQPSWVLLLIVGALIAALPSVSFDKEHYFTTHHPNTLLPVFIGCTLILIGMVGFGISLWQSEGKDASGVDLTKVSERNGFLSTMVNDCEIRVCEGRIETYQVDQGIAVALPCNEYFDDHCMHDTRSSLGSYVSRYFSGQVEELAGLVRQNAEQQFGEGTIERRTEREQAMSFGTGHCLLLQNPLGRPNPIAFVSTTTQRAREGLRAEISCLFDGMHELNKALADARINEVVMPLLGGGHGGISAPLALIGLLLAVAEAARYGVGAQRMRRVTIIVFKPDSSTPAVVDRTIARKTLALVGTQN